MHLLYIPTLLHWSSYTSKRSTCRGAQVHCTGYQWLVFGPLCGIPTYPVLFKEFFIHLYKQTQPVTSSLTILIIPKMFVCILHLPNNFEHEWSHENLRVKKFHHGNISLSTVLTIVTGLNGTYATRTNEMGHTEMDETNRPYGNRKYVLISINRGCNLHKPNTTSSFLCKHKQSDHPTCNTNVIGVCGLNTS